MQLKLSQDSDKVFIIQQEVDIIDFENEEHGFYDLSNTEYSKV